MRAATAFLFSFVASTLAYSVITPSTTTPWTTGGSQPVTWSRVSTDRLNFTILLVNQQMSGFQPQVLSALVDGTTESTQVNPPGGGFVPGGGYQVNFVQDTNDLNTILAQSSTFNITQAATSSTSATGSNTGTTNIPTTTTTSLPTTQAGVSTTSGTNTASSASGSASSSAIPVSGGTASYPVQTGLLAFFSLLGFVLAQ